MSLEFYIGQAIMSMLLLILSFEALLSGRWGLGRFLPFLCTLGFSLGLTHAVLQVLAATHSEVLQPLLPLDVWEGINQGIIESATAVVVLATLLLVLKVRRSSAFAVFVAIPIAGLGTFSVLHTATGGNFLVDCSAYPEVSLSLSSIAPCEAVTSNMAEAVVNFTADVVLKGILFDFVEGFQTNFGEVARLSGKDIRTIKHNPEILWAGAVVSIYRLIVSVTLLAAISQLAFVQWIMRRVRSVIGAS